MKVETKFAAVVGWCDEWKVVAISDTHALAQKACDEAMQDSSVFPGTFPEYQWIEEVPYIAASDLIADQKLIEELQNGDRVILPKTLEHARRMFLAAYGAIKELDPVFFKNHD